MDPEELQRKLLTREELKPVLVVETDGGHLPMRGEEPWKEAKVGVIRTATIESSDDSSKTVVIDKENVRYVAVLGEQTAFEAEMRAALKAEGGIQGRFVAWLGDGAPANWNLAQTLAPGCVEILDWHHAVEHGMTLGRALLGDDSYLLLEMWKPRLETLLHAGDNDALISELMDCLSDMPASVIGQLDDLVRYYRANRARMNYEKYKSIGLPIGSGTVESAHRHVLQVRMKRAGQHWSLPRARRMARLRAAYRTAGAAHFHHAIRSTPVQSQRTQAKKTPSKKRYASNR